MKESHRDGRRYLSARLLGTLFESDQYAESGAGRNGKVRLNLKKSVGEEIDGESHEVLLIRDSQVLLHAIQLLRLSRKGGYQVETERTRAFPMLVRSRKCIR